MEMELFLAYLRLCICFQEAQQVESKKYEKKNSLHSSRLTKSSLGKACLAVAGLSSSISAVEVIRHPGCYELTSLEVQIIQAKAASP